MCFKAPLTSPKSGFTLCHCNFAFRQHKESNVNPLQGLRYRVHNPKWPSIELLYKNMIFKRHFFHLPSCSGVNHKHFLEVQVQNGQASVKKPIDDQLLFSQKLAGSHLVGPLLTSPRNCPVFPEKQQIFKISQNLSKIIWRAAFCYTC